MAFDLLIENGTVIDGSGRPGRLADVGVEGDRIVAVGELGHAEAVRRVDARGLLVAPGFVDPHSHTDLSIHGNRRAESTIRQGVTTEVVGNCGLGNAPVSDLSIERVRRGLHPRGCGVLEVGWRSFGGYLADLEADGTSQNLAFLVAHSAVRAAVGVTGHDVSPSQQECMERHVEEAMESGALGLSSGLEYDEGRDATTEELVRLARVAGRYGGYYASHIRNRDRWILESISEFVEIVRASHTRGQISHLNVRYRTGAPDGAWSDAAAMMQQARLEGLDIQADMTPFRYGLGRMIGILPRWFLEPGYAAAARSLSDARLRARLRHDCDRYWRFLAAGEWERARPLDLPGTPELAGLTFAEISAARGIDPWDCFFDILGSAGHDMVHLNMVGELFTEEHLIDQLRHPLFSLGVDAYSCAAEQAEASTQLSPLSFCGHIHYLTHHVRDERNVPLEEAIRKMTSLPADRFGLHARGLLVPRYHADIVVLDLAHLHSDSTWERPAVYPEGIPYVLVNGRLVVDGGTHNGSRPGRVLRRT